ncbi:MAG: PEP-CTERM sorting domain-containing protein [Thiobacillaceae bacterium]
MPAHGLRPSVPLHTLPEGHTGWGIGGLGGLGMAAAPLVDVEPPVVTPVPEPVTWLMLASGLALLNGRLRHRPAMSAGLQAI